MKRENFIKIIDALKVYFKRVDGIHEILGVTDNTLYEIGDCVFDLLCAEFGTDERETHDDPIIHFCLEQNFGEISEPFYYNDEVVLFTNAGDLYDYLMRSQNFS